MLVWKSYFMLSCIIQAFFNFMSDIPLLWLLSKCLLLHPQIRSIYLSANDSLHFPLTKTVINKLIYQNMVHGVRTGKLRQISSFIMTAVVIGICTLYCYYFLQFISILFRGWSCCKQLAEILKRRKHYFHFDNIHKIQLNSLNIKTRRGWCPRTGLRAAVNEYFSD